MTGSAPSAAERELDRVVAALGPMVEGGALSDAALLLPLQPGGAANAAGYLLLRVEALPLPEAAAAALQRVGYVAVPASERDYHGPGGTRLEICAFEDDGDCWLERLAVRALLRAEPPHGRVAIGHFRDPERIAAATTRQLRTEGFAPLRRLAAALAGCESRWSVASGWSLALHLGAPKRLHDDLDVAVRYRDERPLLHRLQRRGWRLDVVVGPGRGVGKGVYRPWRGERVDPPIHQVHARPADDPLGGTLIDVLLTPGDADEWRFRRDPEARLGWDRARLWRDLDGIAVPYLAPEIGCLYKIGGAGGRVRSKDRADLERILPTLPPASRGWLRRAVARRHPESAWLARIAPEA